LKGIALPAVQPTVGASNDRGAAASAASALNGDLTRRGEAAQNDVKAFHVAFISWGDALSVSPLSLLRYAEKRLLGVRLDGRDLATLPIGIPGKDATLIEVGRLHGRVWLFKVGQQPPINGR
jgi:hypothetical protein